ncbi:hypothetical protein [Spiroplasma attinicola]|uniref:hypothetical protein n=1 Tax=Spiroplasma attinicola TaxID=2904537 RepID=UPI002022B5D9|nr:hypothetical protein [Spiroplasma sp. JKS002670]MCL8210001.1 hypothetical protein [Spiroplasma sp. JKS002670]
MLNKDSETIWKEINEIINKAEVSFDEALDIFDNIEKLSKDSFRKQINKSIRSLYIYVIKILKNINFIVKEKLNNEFFLKGWCTEPLAILNYSYEWLQKHFIQNPTWWFSDIYDYNYWEIISFFKLITSCIDKVSFAIYCEENKEVWNKKNTIKSETERVKQVEDIERKINFDSFVDKLKTEKELITFFDNLEIFHKKIENSTFWKMSKTLRNNLEHRVLFLNNGYNVIDFTIVNIFINLKLLWFINIKSNITNLTHFERMMSSKQYKVMEPILISVINILENKEISDNIPNEMKLIAYDWINALAGEKIDWNKYTFIYKTIINFIIKNIDISKQLKQ